VSDHPPQYDDGRIACGDSALSIRMYYFPFGTKRIPYDRIRSARRFSMGPGITTGRWRIWGSGDFVHWFNLDPKRPNKTAGLELDLGKRAIPVITPDDVESVVAVLAAHGVQIEQG
jgi:hypothetical protein